MIGVRETWLHPGLPARSARAVFATPQPPSSAVVEEAAGRDSDQANAEGLDHDSAKEPHAVLCGQVERHMHAATVADD